MNDKHVKLYSSDLDECFGNEHIRSSNNLLRLSLRLITTDIVYEAFNATHIYIQGRPYIYNLIPHQVRVLFYTS